MESNEYVPDHSLFDGYEVHPCVIIETDEGQAFDQCERDDPNLAVWGVYGHLKTGGLEWISDHSSEAEAVEVLSRFESALC